MLKKGAYYMKRIMVVGVSAGVGKTTFAQRLGKLLHHNVYHLDALFWNPGWIEASLHEFTASQEEIVGRESWIIEGNYSNTFQLRMKNADTIIYLELPLRVCMFRVVKRWITYYGQKRPDLGGECTEKLDWAFIKFIFTTYHARKRKMRKRFETFKAMDSRNRVIMLTSKKEVEKFLNQIEKGC
jgi:adenylate kinase family enzyme